MTDKELTTESLSTLNRIRNALRDCQSIEEIVEAVLEKVCRQLNSQVACFYLFKKNGVIERVGIHGVDRDGNPIENDWLPEEKYKPGEGFSGKSIPQAGAKNGDGDLCRSDNLIHDPDFSLKYGREYVKKLGRLEQAISVPLNFLNRTHGTLQVLNKNINNKFTSEEETYLMLISSVVSGFIYDIRRKHIEEIYNEITRWIFNAEVNQTSVNLQEIYQFLATELIAPVTFYKVCIIRQANEQGDFEVMVEKGTDDIYWTNRHSNPVKKNAKTTISRASEKKTALYEDITAEAIAQGQFHNPVWIRDNNLQSLACLPLIFNGEMIGNINVYSAYKHIFFQSDRDFLENIAFVTASIIATDRIKKSLRVIERELTEERHKFFATSRQVSYSSVMRGFLHQYKNELIGFSEVFSQLSEDSSKSIKQKQQIINKQKGWIQKRVAEISKEFREGSDDANVVNINRSIQYVATLFVSDEPDIELWVNYDEEIPEIEVSEAKIKDVIYNLVDNAITAIKRAKRKKGQLSVATSIITLSRIQYIEVVIQDNGDGIPSEIQDYIFEQGFTTRSKDGGTGMGLFVANAIITDYGGKISVDSKIGQGTTFKVRIPLKRYMI
jgi:nitrogen-specific signal transduction histidine kinase